MALFTAISATPRFFSLSIPYSQRTQRPISLPIVSLSSSPESSPTPRESITPHSIPPFTETSKFSTDTKLNYSLASPNGSNPVTRFVRSTESNIERAIFDFRFLALLAVGGSLAGSLLCFLNGCVYIFEAYKIYWTCCVKGDHTGQMVLRLVEAIVMLLLSCGMATANLQLNLGRRFLGVSTESDYGQTYKTIGGGGYGGNRRDFPTFWLWIFYTMLTQLLLMKMKMRRTSSNEAIQVGKSFSFSTGLEADHTVHMVRGLPTNTTTTGAANLGSTNTTPGEGGSNVNRRQGGRGGVFKGVPDSSLNQLDSNSQLREMMQNREFLPQETSLERMQQVFALQQSLLSNLGQSQSAQ